MNRFFIVLIGITAMLLGCSQRAQPEAVGARGAPAAMTAQPDHGTLSREHMVSIDVPEAALAASFRRVSDRCESDSAHHCTVLESTLSSGKSVSGLIRVRIDTAAVNDFVAFASSMGTLQHRASRIEDIATTIADTQARVAMLTTYRSQLLALRGKVGSNVDAAIKLAAELARVQTDLEQASGEAAYLAARTSTDIVAIELAAASQHAFWHVIGEALEGFAQNLASGISQAITATAYVVPWMLVLVPALFLLRSLWRWRRRSGR